MAALALLGTAALATAAPNSPTAAQAPAQAVERDRLRAQQSGPMPARASQPLSTQTIRAAGAVSRDLVGIGVADLTVGPGSTLQKGQQLGAGWMLGWINWQGLEPSEGHFTFNDGTGNDIDNLIRAGLSANLKILARLQNVPAWATTDGSGRLVAVRPDALQTFTRALAAHSAGRVAAYEIFNEPNLNYEWGQDLDAGAPARYAQLLRAAYLGIKAGDPSAVVVSAGLADSAGGQSMDDLQYLRGVYAAGARGGTHFDAVGTHPYGGSYAPEQDPGCAATCWRRAELQRRIMLDYADGATPMWATEAGWLLDSPYDIGPYFNWMKVSAQQQADYLTRSLQYAQANWPWMRHVFIFNLDHSTTMWCGGPCYPSNSSVPWFSLLNPDRSPRPAYTAVQSLLGGPPPTANLKLSATSVVAGGGLTATWSNNTAPMATDWLGLFPVGAPNTGWVEKKYVSCSQAPGQALASGACQFRLGVTLRSYEVRMFSGTGALLATSPTVTVTAPPTSGPMQALSQAPAPQSAREARPTPPPAGNARPSMPPVGDPRSSTPPTSDPRPTTPPAADPRSSTPPARDRRPDTPAPGGSMRTL